MNYTMKILYGLKYLLAHAIAQEDTKTIILLNVIICAIVFKKEDELIDITHSLYEDMAKLADNHIKLREKELKAKQN